MQEMGCFEFRWGCPDAVFSVRRDGEQQAGEPGERA